MIPSALKVEKDRGVQPVYHFHAFQRASCICSTLNLSSGAALTSVSDDVSHFFNISVFSVCIYSVQMVGKDIIYNKLSAVNAASIDIDIDPDLDIGASLI